MKRRVVVTGLGVVSSLSCRVDELWSKVLAGESGIHDIRLFDTTDFKVKFGGDVYDWEPVDYMQAKELKRNIEKTILGAHGKVAAATAVGRLSGGLLTYIHRTHVATNFSTATATF